MNPKSSVASRMSIALVLALSLMLVACGDDSSDSPEPGAQDDTATEAPMTETMTITATDYAFDMEATYPAGTHTFELANEGEELHFIEVIELKADAPPAEELIKIKKADKYFVRPAGGTKPVKPGETSPTFEMELTPGRYGYVCFIETKDGKPHAFLGMVGEFTVE